MLLEKENVLSSNTSPSSDGAPSTKRRLPPMTTPNSFACAITGRALRTISASKIKVLIMAGTIRDAFWLFKVTLL